MLERSISRRRFLQVGGATVAVAGIAGGGDGASPPLQPRIGRVDVGSPDDYVDGDLRHHADAPCSSGATATACTR